MTRLAPAGANRRAVAQPRRVRVGSVAMGQRLGILGAGQLARMLAEAALRQGLPVIVLTPSADVPAAIDGVELIIGELDDTAALDALFARCDCVTVENEFLSLEQLRGVHARHPRVRLRPSAHTIAVAQDKLEQKRLFTRLGIPTAEFETVAVNTLPRELRRLARRFPAGYVLKWSRQGYDGRGNFVVAKPQTRQTSELHAFCLAGVEAGATIYAERLVDFSCELAMVSARSDDGDQRFFPLVVSRQEAGVCREVVGPAVSFGVDRRLERQVRANMTAIGEAVDLCGCFAVEFFLTRDGALLANEMAPRVHNTGHYTLCGRATSQFDLHVQAVSGLPLSRTATRRLAAMRNILAPQTVNGRRWCPPPCEPPPPGVALYWYGKRKLAAGRKMGHLTARAASVDQLATVLEAMSSYEQRFWSRLADDNATSAAKQMHPGEA